MTEQKIGHIIDGLGLTLDLGEGDLIASAVVLCKIIKPDGETVFGFAHSEGMCWIESIGLVTIGAEMIKQGYVETLADDEEP